MAIPTEQSFLTASQNDEDHTRTKNEKKVDRSSASLSYIIGTIVVGLVTLSFLYAGGTTTTTTTTPYSSNYYGSAEPEINLLRSNTAGESVGTNEMGMEEGEGFIQKLKHIISHIYNKSFKKKLKHHTIQWPLVLYSSFLSNFNIYKGTGELGAMATPFAPAGRPTTIKQAAANGWKPLEKECVPNLGYPWAFDGKITDGAPVTLYYSKETKQNDGVLTGLAVHYYDNAAPDTMIGSVFLKGDDYDTLQVAFHDKNTDVCGGGSLFSNEPYIALLLADGKGRKSFPMTEDAAKASGEWAKGSCLNGMGVHYWTDIKYGSNLSFEAENLYPMAPMYNQKDGSLNGIMFVAAKLMHTWDTKVCGLPPTQECLTTTNFWDVGPGQIQKQTDPPGPLSMCNNFCGDCQNSLTGALDVFDTMHWFFVKGGEDTTCAPEGVNSC